MHSYVSRQLIVRHDQSEKTVQDMDVPHLGRVVVVVAEPGAGKSAFTEALSDTYHARHFTASGFLIRSAEDIKAEGEHLLIIDGLDEVARKRWGDGVIKVLERLNALGCPNVVITCRAAEWGGAQNRVWIRDTYGENPVEGHFVPFSSEELVALVESFDPDVDAREFLDEAGNRDLEEMLGNPESLRLLLSSVKGGSWPRTRAELFQRATENAVQETSERQMTSQRADNRRLIEAAGEIFAHVLLSGLDGVDLVQDDVPGFQYLGDFTRDDQELYQAAVGTRLFRSQGGTSLSPAHRMVAEYVGAQCLTTGLNAQRLSIRRLTAAIAPDGFVRTDLRGMHAWLATLGPVQFRRQAIERDPYGVLRYGDPTGFSSDDKRRLLRGLKKLAKDDPYFRAAEGWTRPLIAGFFDPALRDDVTAILMAGSRNYHLNTLLLDAIRGSGFASSLAPDLLEIAEDENRPYGERSDAVDALSQLPETEWSALVKRLRKRKTNDSARLSLAIAANRKSEGIEPVLIADAIFDAMLMNSDDRDAGLSMSDYAVVQGLSAPLLEPVLNRLSERMAFMCDGRRRFNCNCVRALSPTVIRLVERYFQDSEQHPTADQLWKWLRKTYDSRGHVRETKAMSAALKSNDTLRRAIQARALRAPEFEENPWMALWRLSEQQDAFGPTAADIAHHMEEATAAELSAESISFWTDLARWGAQYAEVRGVAQRHSSSHPELAAKWAEISRPRKPSREELRLKAHERKWKRKAAAAQRARTKVFEANRDKVQGGAHHRLLIDIAKAYLDLFSDISGETPEARLADLLGEDGVNTAIAGLRAALQRDDLPILEKITEASNKGEYWPLEHVICAGILAHVKNGDEIAGIPFSVLESALASSFCESAFNKASDIQEMVEQVVFANEELVESFARRFFEPQVAMGGGRIDKLYLLTSDDRFSFCAGRLAIEWLERFRNVEAGIQRQLLQAAILFCDTSAITNLVHRRCATLDMAERQGALETTDPHERFLWITAAFLLDFNTHLSMISAFAQEARNRLWLFCDIVAPDIHRRQHEATFTWPRLGVSQNRFLLEIFAPDWPAENHPPSGWVGSNNPWDAHEFLRSRARAIGSSDHPSAGEALDALIENSGLSHHHDELRHLRAGWRRRRHDAYLEVPNFAIVREILRDGTAKSVSDLQAVMLDALQWLQEDICDGDTKGWLRFWAGTKPHDENDCRDHILDRIRHRFEPVNVQLRPECRMPEDKRVDIVASLMLDGAIYDLPVEVKGQWHKEIWVAAVTQLDKRYARYVNARGRGLYLVLWFGKVTGKSLPRRADRLALPTTPQELQEMLVADLPTELKNRIEVFVLDVSKPSST